MTQNYKRIAKNTMFLYSRMIIIMAVGFYTVRIVLDVMGVLDYGLYSLVASFVAMMTFLNATLISGTQRFLTFEIGKNNLRRLKQTFSTALLLHICMALLILIFGETIGLWFLYEKMNIPPERFDAVFLAYQFAVLSTMVSVVQVPYNALIIAHEKMHIFAYISIAEAVLKLLIVYLLIISPYDKLSTYGLLLFLVSSAIAMFYGWYVRKNYQESHFEYTFDKDIVKPMLHFSGWSLFGSSAWIVMNHGINIVLSLFYGPIPVAARAIAMLINGGLIQFVSGFRTALNPQIIKYYSSNDLDSMKELTLKSAKYTFYLALLLILPMYLEIESILRIWLIEIPEWTIEFTKLILIFTLIQTFDYSFGIIFQATGEMKYNQILSGGVYLLVIPIFLIFNKYYDLNPLDIVYIQIFAAVIVSFVVKIFLLKKIIQIHIREYIHVLIAPILKILFYILLFNILLTYFKFIFFVNIFFNVIFIVTIIIIFDIDSETKIKIYNKYFNLSRRK